MKIEFNQDDLLKESSFITKLADLLFPHFSRKFLFEPRIFGAGEGRKVVAEENVVLMNTLFNIRSGSIYIGKNTFFGHNVCLLTGSHDIRKIGVERQRSIPAEGNDIIIGADCWISSNVTIIGPCEIERNVVIAAGAVVSGDRLESGWIYAGVPAKKIKEMPSEY